MWFLVYKKFGILVDGVIHCSIKSLLIIQALYHPEIITHVGVGLDGH